MTADYTKKQLLAAMPKELEASPRLLRTWVEAGLMSPPRRRGRGRGGGSSATYSENQLQLFRTLLEHRKRGARPAQLANVPVWLWLGYGEEHVSLGQVRRALTTWGRAVRSAPRSSADSSAARVTRSLSGRRVKPSRQRWLRTVLADISTELLVDRHELSQAAREVIDPQHTRKPRGPVGAQLRPEAYSELVAARVDALELIIGSSDKVFTDEEFLEARTTYLDARADYARRVGDFQRDPEIGDLFETPSPEVEINSAAQHLVELLGLQRRNPRK